MKIEEVKKLSPMDRFLYWIKTRHQIYLKRKAGKPKPWTDDEVLQSYFFTNPYRENDKVTIWFRENVRDPLRDNPRILMATIIFRWFVWIPTGENLLRGNSEFGLLEKWNKKLALKLLCEMRERKEKVFTGAYMITSPAGTKKVEAICDRIEKVWRNRKQLLSGIEESTTLENAHKLLMKCDGLGGFMAYEIVCDLRYTYLLENARDRLKWCNSGPGAIRGLYRIAEKKIKDRGDDYNYPIGYCPKRPKDWLDQMRELRRFVSSELSGSGMPRIEMREIEHSLCEFDKYERMRLGDGKSKRIFRGK